MALHQNGRPKPFNPRDVDCTHNRQRLLIEERIQNFENQSEEIDQETERIFKVLKEFEDHFNNFGSEHHDKLAIQIIKSVREKQSKQVIILGEKYFDLQIYIIEYPELMQKIINDSHEIQCWCSKLPIGSKNH